MKLEPGINAPENSSKVSEESSTPADNRLYCEIIGSLVYIMTETRPDLCYSVTKLSQHLSAPTVSRIIIIIIFSSYIARLPYMSRCTLQCTIYKLLNNLQY